MTKKILFEDLKNFINAEPDDRILYNYTDLLGHFAKKIPEWKSNFSISFSGIFRVRINTGELWNPIYLEAEDLTIPQFLSTIIHCKTYREVKEIINNPMELSKDQVYILSIANKTLANNEVDVERALQLVNSMLDPESKAEIVFVVDALTRDRLQVYDSTKHHYDIFNQYYWLSDDRFIKIHRKNGTYFRGHRNSINYDLAFWCEDSEKWYYPKDYTAVNVNGRTVCYEVNSHRVFRWESDGNYHYEAEDTGVKKVRNSIDGYHCSVRPAWWKNAQGIGMELEINCNNRNKLVSQLSHDIMAEKDGSLDDSKGVELIGGPYTCKDYQNDKTPWKDTLEKVKKIGGDGYFARGSRSNQTEYGIHLSLSRSLFTTLHAAKFIVFFNQQSPLVKLVAQRSTIYGGNYGIRPKIKNTLKDTLDLNAYDHKQQRCKKKTKSVQTGKYEPVYADEKRLEVRVFKSNLRWERILKNIEFVQAVFDFTRDCGISIIADPDQGTIAFLDWLQKQNDFKTLKEFLYESKNRKSFLIETTNVTNNDLLKPFNFKPKTIHTTDSEL